MTYDELLTALGPRQLDVARALGAKQPTVARWKIRGNVPRKWQDKATAILTTAAVPPSADPSPVAPSDAGAFSAQQ